ncbi:MAG TPA: glycine C-acetyltransferase [Actinomycetaceae bacterium]|nr:glycine C-acetyltransferase [Actinomycetaceae bacterium]
MYGIKDQLTEELEAIRAAGLWKAERELTTPQRAEVATAAGGAALNFCANNYLGLADNAEIIAAARDSLDRWGFGMASVRFICGTQTQHTALEREIAEFLGQEAAILYSSCFDANGGVFEVLFGPDDAIISDQLNHASIIDGVRLSRARRFRYLNADLEDLRRQLLAARDGGARRIVVVTDGVFSMDGSFAPLPGICDLAEEFGALVMVDDSHATGFVGEGGRGTPEHFGVMERIDMISGTLGKALGGASGGFIAARTEIVDLLRQRSRPYLFSNSVAPSVVAGARTAIRLAAGASAGRLRLRENSAVFRRLMTDAGFTLLPGEHPIHAVMFEGDDGAREAGAIADAMLELGVYVIAFSFPVVPRGKARIRVQLSAAHSEGEVRRCVAAFVEAREQVGKR